MSDEHTSKPPRRRRGTREETEANLLDATLRVLGRSGLLEGISLRDIAAEAGVNHGQIYQYFGSRQELMRAAIARQLDDSAREHDTHWDATFAERRSMMWHWALDHPNIARLEALLAVENDSRLVLFPELERTRAALERDVENGHLKPDIDTAVAHAMTAVTYMGYCIFREAIARELGVGFAELDSRAEKVYDQLISAFTAKDDEPESAHKSSGVPQQEA